ncbi:hypothetical protein ZWY2020_038804 [Hordeum vulgare]|nr:hypothetical protein ZWY2020_038804 [Hordeum vulgare]
MSSTGRAPCRRNRMAVAFMPWLYRWNSPRSGLWRRAAHIARFKDAEAGIRCSAYERGRLGGSLSDADASVHGIRCGVKRDGDVCGRPELSSPLPHSRPSRWLLAVFLFATFSWTFARAAASARGAIRGVGSEQPWTLIDLTE